MVVQNYVDSRISKLGSSFLAVYFRVHCGASYDRNLLLHVNKPLFSSLMVSEISGDWCLISSLILRNF